MSQPLQSQLEVSPRRFFKTATLPVPAKRTSGSLNQDEKELLLGNYNLVLLTNKEADVAAFRYRTVLVTVFLVGVLVGLLIWLF